MAARAHSGRCAYPVHDFLDDQQRLLGTGQTSRGAATGFEDLDGPLHVVHTRRLRTALASDDIPAPFHDKYGDSQEQTYCARCERVVRFLERWRGEIVQSGLAVSRDDPLAVREDFLNFLLNYETAPGETAIPADALTGFLDQWGHRWM
jgi:hypothetical protein